MRSAKSHFYWRRRSTDQRASQSDKQAVRRRSRIQVRVCGQALDMALVAFGTCAVTRSCDCYRAATSNPSVSAAARQGTRQSISAKWMHAPVRIDRKPGRWGDKWPAESAREHRRWKDLGQILGKARERSFISFRLLNLPI
jgi:hypothetical protein